MQVAFCPGGLMFTKADYLTYLALLSEKQRSMILILEGLIGQMAGNPLAVELKALLQEKQRAYEAVDHLFGRLFGLSVEQRRYQRSPALADVKLRNLESGEMIVCRCLDMSLGGLCVQLPAALPLGVLLAMEIRFFESGRPLVRRGTVRWCRQTEDGGYRAGFQFEELQATQHCKNGIE